MAFSIHDSTPAELVQRLAAERRGRPFLLYRAAERAQRLLTLAGERISVGREPGNELPLPWDPEASRVHALLEAVEVAGTPPLEPRDRGRADGLGRGCPQPHEGAIRAVRGSGGPVLHEYSLARDAGRIRLIG